MIVDERLTSRDLLPDTDRLWAASGPKIRSLSGVYDPERGAPVYTVSGRYTARGWTEWTQGFEVGSAILQYDATGETAFLELGRDRTRDVMAPHLTHFGVHDHGFNNVSTYGNLLRLMAEGRIPFDAWEAEFYRLALKVSGAVQARRWTPLPDGMGFIHSFNGPHSLFIDTVRSLRVLALAHQLGHVYMHENDSRESLLRRLVAHALTTARYNVFYGKGRDIYDLRGRVAHESIFNIHDGRYRCPSTQQGYAPFSTWMRGLGWACCGFAEILEWMRDVPEADFEPDYPKAAVESELREATAAVCDFYLDNTAADGIPYWDTGAPGLAQMGDWRARESDPFNDFEPVDSSAAAITAQGLIRFGRYLGGAVGARYVSAGLGVARTLMSEPYLCVDPDHQGLVLHSQYHRPNGWDHVPNGSSIPAGEATMWGDYHARELALLIGRLAADKPYPAFFAIG